LQWFLICFNEICIKIFEENGHFVEEIWQKQTRVELNNASMKRKYSSEDKVVLRTLKLFLKSFFFLVYKWKNNKYFVVMFCRFANKIIMFQETLKFWKIIFYPTTNKQ
jgi:hypothetical protein